MMSKEDKVLKEIKWLGAKAIMRTIKPRTIITPISFLQAKLVVDEIENSLKEKENG